MDNTPNIFCNRALNNQMLACFIFVTEIGMNSGDHMDIYVSTQFLSDTCVTSFVLSFVCDEVETSGWF
jgi:hypothetical protein